jgi:uncharacterized metal-binding protein
MRFSIALLENRIAPRCTVANCLMFGTVKHGRITFSKSVKQKIQNSLDLGRALQEHKTDTFICGGIRKETIELLESMEIAVIPNVAGTIDEVRNSIVSNKIKLDEDVLNQQENRGKLHFHNPAKSHQDVLKSKDGFDDNKFLVDSTTYTDKMFINDEKPPDLNIQKTDILSIKHLEMLDVANDISFEKERQLCRLSELVYFCLEMGYKKIGIAYCADLEDPVHTLTWVLRRFFTVIPICCNIEEEPNQSAVHLTCNPSLQADTLNRLETDFNVIVGLCIGSDSVFTQLSNAPVTVLFVKDRALANNPIGAVYSDKYLKEASNLSGLASNFHQELAIETGL